jgi:ppGpp synthetase/RelA/SpoT-type nucleotidyltranferase
MIFFIFSVGVSRHATIFTRISHVYYTMQWQHQPSGYTSMHLIVNMHTKKHATSLLLA